MIKYALNSKTAYWTHHDSSLPAIVMIHGFRGTHHGLDLIAKALPDFHIIVPDLPGFGESKPLIAKHTLENYTKWLEAFMEDLALPETTVLLGHSFGSIIASSYASKNAGAISKLILVNPIGAPALEGPKGAMTQLAIVYYYLGERLPLRLAHAWLSTKPIVMMMSITMAKTKNKQLRAFIHSQHLAHFSTFANPQVVAEAFTTSTRHTVRDLARIIVTPTLLIAGDQDDITPLAKQQELVRLFPKGTLQIIKGVGHLTHYETPKRVAQFVRAFIC